MTEAEETRLWAKIRLGLKPSAPTENLPKFLPGDMVRVRGSRDDYVVQTSHPTYTAVLGWEYSLRSIAGASYLTTNPQDILMLKKGVGE